jgi:hypothetical protein
VYADNIERNPYEIAYMQMYTTDKSVTFHQAGRRHAKYLKATDALKGTPPVYCAGLYEAYRQAQNMNDCAARLEVRIPIDHAETVLTTFPNALIKQCLLNFKREKWW